MLSCGILNRVLSPSLPLRPTSLLLRSQRPLEQRRRLERLCQMVETTDLDVSDLAPRFRGHREHRERQGRL